VAFVWYEMCYSRVYNFLYSILNNFPYLYYTLSLRLFCSLCRSVYTPSQNILGSSSSLSTENSLKHYINREKARKTFVPLRRTTLPFAERSIPLCGGNVTKTFLNIVKYIKIDTRCILYLISPSPTNKSLFSL